MLGPLKGRGLELSSEKTVITHIEDGFDFLGQNVRKYHGKLLIKPSKKNVRAFLDKVRGIIWDNKQATAGHLVCQLNRVLRGWARYHRHVVSKATFNSVKADAITSRLKNDRPEKTYSKEQDSLNADERTPTGLRQNPLIPAPMD